MLAQVTEVAEATTKTVGELSTHGAVTLLFGLFLLSGIGLSTMLIIKVVIPWANTHMSAITRQAETTEKFIKGLDSALEKLVLLHSESFNTLSDLKEMHISPDGGHPFETKTINRWSQGVDKAVALLLAYVEEGDFSESSKKLVISRIRDALAL